MYKSVFLSLFLSVAFCSIAQKPAPSSLTRESLLKNPDILWVGESEELVLLDVDMEEKASDPDFLTKRGIKSGDMAACPPIKNQHDRRQPILYPEDLAWINKAIYGDKFKNMRAYKDAACTQLVKNPQDLAKSFDTLIVFDPNTFNENIEVVVNPINPNNIKSYKLRQLFYFDKKANAFGSLPLAFAPVLTIYDDYDMKKFSTKELCWIKIEHSTKSLDLGSKDILWARQVSRSYNLEKMTTLKSEKSVTDCLEMQLETIRKNAATEKVYGALFISTPISPNEVKSLGIEIDTMFSFNMETMEELMSIKVDTCNLKNVTDVHFIQEWYWDERQNKMLVHNLFFAPLLTRVDKKWTIPYTAPLYYKEAK